MKFARFLLPMLIVAAGISGAAMLNLAGCAQNGTPAAVTQRDIYNTAYSVYAFQKQLLTDVHASGGIRDVTWQTKYLPKFAAADVAFDAWNTAIDKPGSAEAQRAALAAAADIALLVIDATTQNAAAVQQSAQRLQAQRPQLRTP